MACDSPVWIKSKGQDIPVPCNRCPPCKHRRINEWVFRIMWEERYNSIASHFVTLTYGTEHVPLTPNGFMSLRKTDLQKFFKRLRKNTGLRDVKYYACGEYGSKTNRPHYHAIIFGWWPKDAVPWQKAKDGSQLYTSAVLDKVWGYGFSSVGAVTFGSALYVAQYVVKKQQKLLKKQTEKQLNCLELMLQPVQQLLSLQVLLAWYLEHQAESMRGITTITSEECD